MAEQNTLAKLQEEGGDKLQNYNNAKTPAEQQAVLKQYDESYKTAANKAQDWGIGGNNSRAVNAVTAAITGALGGQTNLQVAANTLAPYAAQTIGENFGHGDNKNTAAQMASHAILGATLAYINGGDPAAGGTAAVASEAAANYLTQQYKDDKRYQNAQGEFMPNLLPESEKAKIRTLTSAIGAVAGGTVGSSAFNAQLSGVVGQNAVENNYLSEKQEQQKAKELKECDGVVCRGLVQAQWDSISAGQQASLTAGIVAGIPVSVKDSIVGLVDVVTSPIETYKQVKALINKENTLGYISDAMKNSFIQQLDHISESYEQAGAKGSFNAGVETGKLLTDIVSVVSGAGGVTKSAAKGGEIASKLITSPRNPIKLKAEFPENMTVEVAGISGGKKLLSNQKNENYNTIYIENDVLNQKRVGWGKTENEKYNIKNSEKGSGLKIDKIEPLPVKIDGKPLPTQPKSSKNGDIVYHTVKDTTNRNYYAHQERPPTAVQHGFNEIVDNYAGYAEKTPLKNGAVLYQILGGYQNQSGRFEWIIDSNIGGVSHRMFVPNGTLNGVPIKP